MQSKLPHRLAGLNVATMAVVLLLTLCPRWSAAQNTRPSPTVTRETRFSIPFYLLQDATPPQRVDLYLSTNRGQDWKICESRRPDEARFNFQAPQDGEFWFAVRTNLDRDIPNPTTPPGKVVIVDRTQPQLALEVTEGDSGELIASWTAEDQTLQFDALKLAYREESNPQWFPVTLTTDLLAAAENGPESVGPPTSDSADTSAAQSGRTKFVTSAKQGEVIVRFSATDQAGNSQEIEKTIKLAARSLAGDGAPTEAIDAEFHWQNQRSDQWSAKSPTTRWNPETSGLDGWRTTGLATDPQPQPVQVRPSDLNHDDHLPPVQNAATPQLPQARESVYAPPVANRTSPPSFDEPPFGAADVLPRTSDAPSLPPQESPQFGPDDRSDPRDRPSPPSRSLPLQYTSSRRFELDYEVTQSGVGSVLRVELWYTLDDGLTWAVMATDPDKTSPFLVELNEEGVYGFRIHIHDEFGQSAPPPQPGDSPDLSVSVDWTRPRARIVSAEPQLEASPPQVLIRWEAEDEAFGEFPVRLEFAPQPTGPWRPVSDGPLANSKIYRWFPGQPLPARTYLRLIVTDRAGNETTARMDQPLGVGAEPRAVIRRIQPIGEVPSRPRVPVHGPRSTP